MNLQNNRFSLLITDFIFSICAVFCSAGKVVKIYVDWFLILMSLIWCANAQNKWLKYEEMSTNNHELNIKTLGMDVHWILQIIINKCQIKMAPFWRWLENVSVTECSAMFLDRINVSADLDKGSRLVASVLFSIRCEWNGAALPCGILWAFADTSCQIRFCSLMRIFVLKISKASLSGVCKSVSGWEMGRAGINTFFLF